jgi:hypothetical protein
MSYRKFVNFLIFVISILTVNLITTLITDFLMGYKHATHPLKATLIGMALMIFILYPAYNWIDNISENLTVRIFTAGKNAGGKFLGMLWAFGVAFGILFLCYLHLWFHINIWDLF